MKQRTIVRALVLGLAMGAVAGTALAGTPDPDRVWVKFKPGAKAQVEQALVYAGARFHYRFDALDAFAVSVPAQAIQGLSRNPNVEYIEPDVVRHPLAQSRPYGIDLVGAPQVWSQGVTGSGVRVCVIDSGIHAAHEDFHGVDLVGGYPADWASDTCGHGSHVAGTIAAKDNTAGVVGVNTGAIELYILKVFNGSSCGWSYSSTLVDAANRCANAGAKVINMSLGGSTSSTTERNAFQNLYSAGVLSIAAAGNSGNTQHSYPASYDSVISVAALDQNKQHASFSQRTNQVELAAPGVGVLSTVPFESASTVVDGTSYIVSALDGSHQGAASAALADGGRCLSTGAWAGKVVLCERGDVSFADKAKNVANSGGVAAIIYNNAPGGFSGTLGTGAPAIPVVSMTQEDGLVVKAKVGKTAIVSTIANNQGNGYAFYDGTSMATPHVAGVAALIWSANPGWTNAQIREALAVTAEDLGSAGRDNSYGWGLIRADAALAYLQNGGGGGGGDPGVVAPSDLAASVLKNKGKATGVSLGWTAGSASHVDVYRGTAKVAAGIANIGSHTDGYVGAKRERVTYQVCVKDSTSACSNPVSVQF